MAFHCSPVYTGSSLEVLQHPHPLPSGSGSFGSLEIRSRCVTLAAHLEVLVSGPLAAALWATLGRLLKTALHLSGLARPDRLLLVVALPVLLPLRHRPAGPVFPRRPKAIWWRWRCPRCGCYVRKWQCTRRANEPLVCCNDLEGRPRLDWANCTTSPGRSQGFSAK